MILSVVMLVIKPTNNNATQYALVTLWVEETKANSLVFLHFYTLEATENWIFDSMLSLICPP